MKLRFMAGLGALVLVSLASVGCQNKKGPDSANNLNRIHFDFDSSSIRPDMVKIVDGNVSYMKKHPSLNVVVEGHCDERGTNEYNLALGDRRASSVKDYMERRGISDNRLRTVSYGEERPIDKGHNESSWYKNRRAEFTRR